MEVLSEEPMRTIAIATQKGGGGKTTLAVNLAAALAEQNKKFLLIDLDPQCSASAYYGITNGGEGLLEVFMGNKHLTEIVWESDVKNVEIIPACNALAGACP